MSWKIVAGMASVVASAALLLGACAKTREPTPGEPATTQLATEGDWKHVSKWNDYNIDMQCKGTTGIYVLAGYASIAVLGDDPACPRKG